jgi:sugar O-acyltransferase (sialic acid O-acetyltransferase NeuD family)
MAASFDSSNFYVMDAIAIFGAGGHGKVVVDILEREGRCRIGAVYDAGRVEVDQFLGYPLVHEIKDILNLKIRRGIVAIGDNGTRRKLVEAIQGVFPSFEFISATHPSANIGRNVQMGQGTVVMPGACINVDSVIGDHCIINTHASIDHENRLADYVNVSPGVTTGGQVKIGYGAFIGIGATLLEKRHVGDHSFIGGGAVVTSNIPDHALAYGVPCRVVRALKTGEKLM